MVEDFKRRFWISLGLTLPILILSPMIQMFLGLGESIRFAGDTYIIWALSSIVFFYGGYLFLNGMFEEISERKPGMMTLIGVAITTAYVYSTAVVFGLRGGEFFWELATLIDIMLLGHWIEMRSVMGASRALEELARLMPSEAHLLHANGQAVDVPISELKPGDRILIKPGEKIPADSVVIDGLSSVDESMLTGESRPVVKTRDAVVIGGSINGEGSITAEVRKTGKDSYLNQVVDLVRQAQESKSHTQDVANRAASWLTVIALGGGGLTFATWISVGSQPLAFAIERAVTVMVIACPHALGLAVPLVVAVSTALSATHGLLIRDRSAFEQARNLHAVIFDKTGTLTEGKFGIKETLVFDPSISVEELLRYAASIEAHSEHPIAKAVSAAVPVRLPVTEFKAIPGKGAFAKVNGKNVHVVSPGYLKERGIGIPEQARIGRIAAQGATVVYVLFDEKLVGAIALADIIRPESKDAIAQLKQMGIRCLMLTGDNRKVAEWVAKEIGLDEFFAEVLPHEKVDKVKEVQSRGLTVAMTGDGVNDAPALAQADVGIAIGAGTDVAVETADVILVRSNPLDVVSVLALSRITYRKMVQNLFWATGYNAFAIPLAAGVLYRSGIVLSPAMGAVLMSLSTVIVAINARLLRLKETTAGKLRKEVAVQPSGQHWTKVAIPIQGFSRSAEDPLVIEKHLNHLKGVRNVYANPVTEEAYLEIDLNQVKEADIVSAIKRAGFKSGPLNKSA